MKTDERTYNGIVRPEYTPDAISSLKLDEIFVFGSNLHGLHGGGAARAACKKFGAIWGQGVGLQGQSYAISTMQGGVETIKSYVDQFIESLPRSIPNYSPCHTHRLWHCRFQGQ